MPASIRAVTSILNFASRTDQIRFSVRMKLKSIHQSLNLSQQRHVLLDYLIVNVLESISQDWEENLQRNQNQSVNPCSPHSSGNWTFQVNYA